MERGGKDGSPLSENVSRCRLPSDFNRMRRALPPFRVGSVRLGDLRRIRPISDNFGFDRGKPIDRRYIEKFLSRNAADIRGRVLEIGDNEYTIRFGGDRVDQSDILHVNPNNTRATLIGGFAHGDDLPAETFDCIILTQTLHMIFDMRKAVTTVRRMLKPGGVLLSPYRGSAQSTVGNGGRLGIGRCQQLPYRVCLRSSSVRAMLV